MPHAGYMEVGIELVSVSHAARRLGLSADSVRRLADAGRIPYLRLSNRERVFRRVDVEEARRMRQARKRAA